ncbi:helix-turn-helix transcriptional regulator [Enterovirga sp. CN4-39]|uniref:AraC family transcriptional regulator n=1 Tax=Enterovirga sp. CN4-39 TaxID=3400910 RepID=UPI003BFE0CBA
MLATAPFTLSRFSTRGLPSRDRHEAWANRHWPSVAPVYRTNPTEPFDVTVDSLALNSLVLHDATITGQEWIRDSGLIRSWTPDALGVALTVAGRTRGVWDDRGAKSGPGSIQFADFARPSAHASTGGRTIVLTLPRTIATDWGFHAERLHGLVLDSPLANFLVSHLQNLLRSARGLPASSAPALTRGILDLLALAMREVGAGIPQERVGRHGLRLVARRIIDAELGSAALTIERLCRRLRVSRSTLHRAFELEGGVQAYIRSRRLAAAREALENPHGVEPVHAIADRLGFSDAAHLSRLFRSRYGMSPSDCRAQARRQRWSDRP